MSKPPLWKAMTQARYESDGARLASVRHATAAEIRALRDWLVPEKPEPRLSEHCDRDDLVTWHRWDEYQELRDRLTAEADSAERGDG